MNAEHSSWFFFLLILVLPPLCHRNHPQTSAISARLRSFAVSLTSRNPRRARSARLGPGSTSTLSECPFPSREPRRMPSICLGSFSAYLSPPHLFVPPTIPRRAR